MCAQFVALPPFGRIRALFTALTSCTFTVDVCWTKWYTVDVSSHYMWLCDYIRPSHQKLLQETMGGLQPNPCSLLRQLLRPYDYRIEKTNAGWVLRNGKKAGGPRIVLQPGASIVWNDDT